LHVPLLRERTRLASPAPASATEPNDADAVTIDRIKIAGGAFVVANARDRVERRIDNINADAVIDADRKVIMTGTARAGDAPAKFTIKANAPAAKAERQTIPLELTIDAPGLLNAPLSARTDVRLNGTVVMFNGVSGTIGDGAINGWASVDVASKPLVKVDLDF